MALLTFLNVHILGFINKLHQDPIIDIGVGVLLILTYKGPLYLRQDERVRILLKYIKG